MTTNLLIVKNGGKSTLNAWVFKAKSEKTFKILRGPFFYCAVSNFNTLHTAKNAKTKQLNIGRLKSLQRLILLEKRTVQCKRIF